MVDNDGVKRASLSIFATRLIDLNSCARLLRKQIRLSQTCPVINLVPYAYFARAVRIVGNYLRRLRVFSEPGTLGDVFVQILMIFSF